MANSKVARDFNKIIPQEISSEIKLTKGITMRAVIVIVATIFVTEQFSGIVHPSLKIVYNIFSVIVGVCMMLPSSKNPGKLLYQTLMLTFMKDRTVYHPIESEEIEDGN